MKKRKGYLIVLVFACMAALVVPTRAYTQDSPSPPVFKAEELEQILAPIALYPDSLLTQILMASTYPLEIVQADRWVKQNKGMKGDALAKALEAQSWDPSVKSLVNFPQVLVMMSEKIDWTQKVGNAFLAQQKDVMGTVQKLRAKAQASGNLKTTKEQVVKVEQQTIIIESASPQVVYVPAYNPTVVYGAWPYPAYPPPPVYAYPPGAAAVSFAAGVAVGAAWGYAWGNANWHGGNVNINVNQNANINRNINRQNYATQYQGRGQAGQGQWQHDPSHRGGVAYKDKGTAQKYNRGTGGEAAKSREAYRGKTGQGGAGASTQPAGAGARQGTMDRGGQQGGASRPSPSTMESGGRQSAFGGMDKGSNAQMEGNRGQASRQSPSSAQSMQRGGSGGIRGGGSGGGTRGGGRR